MEGMEERPQILARLDGADHQHKPFRKTMFRAHLCQGLCPRQGAKARIRRLVDHADLVGRGAQLADEILAGEFAGHDDVTGMVRRPVDLSVIARRFGGQKVGIVQKSQIVHRDDRFHLCVERRDEIRAVQQIQRVEQHLGGKQILLEPVMRRSDKRRPPEVGLLDQGVRMSPVLEYNKLVILVEFCQRLQQMQGIPADPGWLKMDQPGIDANAHR
jgi:hypothetical protein